MSTSTDTTAPLAEQVAALAGTRLVAVTPYVAYGCGGIDHADLPDAEDDEDGRVWVARVPATVTDAAAEEYLCRVERDWAALWPDRRDQPSDALLTALATAGFTVPARPAPAPVWGPAFTGTRADYQHQAAEATLARNLWFDQLEATCLAAREQVLTRAGLTKVAGYVRGAAEFVHDTGCRCAHYTSSRPGWLLTLTAHGPDVYSLPVDDDLDTALAAADTAASQARAEAAAANAQLITDAVTELVADLRDERGADRYGPARDTLAAAAAALLDTLRRPGTPAPTVSPWVSLDAIEQHELDQLTALDPKALTWAQTSRLGHLRLRAALAAGDAAAVAGLARRRRTLRDEDYAARTAADRALYEHTVARLEADLVAALAALPVIDPWPAS